MTQVRCEECKVILPLKEATVYANVFDCPPFDQFVNREFLCPNCTEHGEIFNASVYVTELGWNRIGMGESGWEIVQPAVLDDEMQRAYNFRMKRLRGA